MTLKYKADQRSVLFVVTFLTVQFGLFRLYPKWELIPFLMMGCAIIGAVNHNQMHAPAFVSKSMNQFWSLILSWGMGSSATQMTVTHILIHHRFFRDSRDWTRYELAHGIGFKRILSYLKNSVLEIRRRRGAFFHQKSHRNWKKQARLEKVMLWAISLTLMWISPLAFVYCYLLPWFGGLLIVLIINLTQHDELDLQSQHHSRDFIGFWCNWFAFNAFFHTVHHEKPSLHWSLLPQEHTSRSLGGQKSFWAYLFRHYLLQRSSY